MVDKVMLEQKFQELDRYLKELEAAKKITREEFNTSLAAARRKKYHSF